MAPFLIIAVSVIVLALIVLAFLRPFRLEYSTAYATVISTAMLGTFGYLVSYSFIKKE